MLWRRFIVMVACYHFLLGSAATYAEDLPVASPLYQCPASLQIGSKTYEMRHADVYDGPIEDMAALKPEPVPDDGTVKPSFWRYEAYSSEHPLYVKCYYQDTAHYVVLKAQGARRCTFTEDTPTVCGE